MSNLNSVIAKLEERGETELVAMVQEVTAKKGFKSKGPDLDLMVDGRDAIVHKVSWLLGKAKIRHNLIDDQAPDYVIFHFYSKQDKERAKNLLQEQRVFPTK